MKNTVRILGIFLMGAVANASANGLSDDTVRQAIEAELQKSKIVNGGGPRVNVDSGVVTLEAVLVTARVADDGDVGG